MPFWEDKYPLMPLAMKQNNHHDVCAEIQDGGVGGAPPTIQPYIFNAQPGMIKSESPASVTFVPTFPEKVVNEGRCSISHYKTELCRKFQSFNTCQYGKLCRFAHGPGELRKKLQHPKYKTELCITFHNTGLCPYGYRCHFIHNLKKSYNVTAHNYYN